MSSHDYDPSSLDAGNARASIARPVAMSARPSAAGRSASTPSGQTGPPPAASSTTGQSTQSGQMSGATTTNAAAPSSGSMPGTPIPSALSSGTPASKAKYVGNYELQQTIGEGSFAKVKIAIHRLTRQKVAIKVIDKTKLPDEYSLKNIHREAQIMRMIDHPNIIQLFEVMETKKNLFLVLEYAAKGELLDYIVANGRLKEDEAKTFVRQIVSALDYAHSHSVVHRDLKAENLLLDENTCVKISDFGLSNVYDPKGYLATSCGSPVYSAPELIEGKKYVGPEVDSWSLGINVYAMVVGDLPFADANLTALYESILRGKYEVPDFVSSDCKDFIAKLLVLNPKKRATVSQIRDHVWLSEGTSFLEPVSNKIEGGFRPRNEESIDAELLDQVEQMGFEKKAAAQAIVTGKFNQAAGTYYLLAYEKQQMIQHGKKSARHMLPAGEQDVRISGGGGGGIGSELLEEDSESRNGAGANGQNASDVTSDELAKVLFQVENIRGTTAVPAKDGRPDKDGRHAVRDSRTAGAGAGAGAGFPGGSSGGPGGGAGGPGGGTNTAGAAANDKRGGGGAGAASSSPVSRGGGTSSADLDPKSGKPVVKRVRGRVSNVTNGGSNVSAGAGGVTTGPGLGPSYGGRMEAEDSITQRPTSSQPMLPKIPQSRTSKTFESKVVNLPSIASNIPTGLGSNLVAANAVGVGPSGHGSPGMGAGSQLGASMVGDSSLKPPPHTPSMDGHERTASSARPQGARRLLKNTPIQIDDTLYLTKEQEGSDSGEPYTAGPMGNPRTIRFAFNCTATTTLPPETLFEKLRTVLDHNDAEWRHEGYLCECEWGDIKFEVEVCKLPRVRSFGIRLKRLSGDIWEYKKLCSKLVNDLA
ncbi:hypothetical protein BC831DRAFT_452162 [Entophlyctis helioformis]|nr:hypothetical protein BC831DRAFT_452162 [Entophlyctis helioformis]